MLQIMLMNPILHWVSWVMAKEQTLIKIFLLQQIIPFHTNSSYPVDDITLRVDAGHSMRTDNSTMIYTIATETGMQILKKSIWKL